MMAHADREEFVSYSANLEDVLLRRIFRDVAKGFFVDVGAAHPEYENDTKALHDRGWRGINIEPNEDFLCELRRQRPEDVNLGVIVAEQAGEAVFYKVPDTGLSTIEAANAERAASSGYAIEERRVPQMTLAQVLDEARAPREFEVLKVDVEGAERAVLTGNDWSRYRPRVILAEATVPESPVRRDDGVRQLLDGVGWRHVWFDGLNDWYLAPDFTPPPGAFESPPNIFDRYVVRRTVEAEGQVRWLQDTLADRERAVTSLQEQETELRRIISEQDKELRKSPGRQEPETRIQQLELEVRRLQGVVAGCVRERDESQRALSALQAAFVASRREVSAAAHYRSELAQHQQMVAALQRDLLASRREVAELAASAEARRSDSDQHQLQQYKNQLDEARQLIGSLLSSTSWRISGPVRVVGRMLKRQR